MGPYVPSDDEVASYVDSLSNWERWGKEDELGTINLLTQTKTVEAAKLVREGKTVSCARSITTDLTPDVQYQPLHFMVESGDGWDNEGKISSHALPSVQAAREFIGFVFHGRIITHVDSPAHFFWKSKLYNGRPANLVSTAKGATAESIELLKDGVVTRGVLLDVAKARGKEWLEPGDGAFPEDLEAAEEACEVRVTEGDVLLIRTGHVKRKNQEEPTNSYGNDTTGPHAACLPWLHKRGVAMLASDTSNEIHPSGYSTVQMPVHQVGLVAMGLWLIDNCDLEELAKECEKRGRWEFLLTIGPLRIRGGTGSPVNPIAVF